jgi:hypothetical protein
MGLGTLPLDAISDEDLEMMSYAAAVLGAGFPQPAFLQLMRVYGQVIAQIADAEVRLIHLYVHEPLMRDGVPSVEVAEEMEELARELLPFAAPFMNYLHGRLPAHFVEQDMIGHMEATSARRRRGGPAARGDRVRRPRGLRPADRASAATRRRSSIVERFVARHADLPDEARA